jgi:ankyrin repeat protein
MKKDEGLFGFGMFSMNSTTGGSMGIGPSDIQIKTIGKLTDVRKILDNPGGINEIKQQELAKHRQFFKTNKFEGASLSIIAALGTKEDVIQRLILDKDADLQANEIVPGGGPSECYQKTPIEYATQTGNTNVLPLILDILDLKEELEAKIRKEVANSLTLDNKVKKELLDILENRSTYDHLWVNQNPDYCERICNNIMIILKDYFHPIRISDFINDTFSRWLTLHANRHPDNINQAKARYKVIASHFELYLNLDKNKTALMNKIINNSDSELKDTAKYFLTKVKKDPRNYKMNGSFARRLEYIQNKLITHGYHFLPDDWNGQKDVRLNSPEQHFNLLCEMMNEKKYDRVKYLIATGSFTNKEINKGLLKAIPLKDKTWMIFFLKNGADPNAADKNYTTALHLAVELGESELVESLLKHGADPNKQKQCGRTALHLAVEKKHMHLIKMLLFTGPSFALANIPDNSNKTAKDYLLPEKQSEDIYKLLEKEENRLNISHFDKIKTSIKSQIRNLLRSREDMLKMSTDQETKKQVNKLFSDQCKKILDGIKNEERLSEAEKQQLILLINENNPESKVLSTSQTSGVKFWSDPLTSTSPANIEQDIQTELMDKSLDLI